MSTKSKGAWQLESEHAKTFPWLNRHFERIHNFYMINSLILIS